MAEELQRQLHQRGIDVSGRFALAWVLVRATEAAELLDVTPEHVLDYEWPVDTSAPRMAATITRMIGAGELDADWVVGRVTEPDENVAATGVRTTTLRRLHRG